MAAGIRVFRYLGFLVLTLAFYDWAADGCFVNFHEPARGIDSKSGQYHWTVANTPEYDPPAVFAVRRELPDGGNRIVASERAQAFLSNLTLFRDGRGMHSTPAFAKLFGLIGNSSGWKQNLMRQWFAGRTGVNFDGANQIVGFQLSEYRGVPVVAQGCAVCHVGKVLGRIVPGLGNKTIDPYALASTGQWETTIDPGADVSNDPAQFLAAGAAHFRNRVADNRLGNLTQGMVSVATIMTWFYDESQEQLPANMTRSAVKVPSLWGYREKRKVGQFCDGFGDGVAGGWPAMVELVGGQRPETVRGYKDILFHTEDVLGDLLPPAYPLAIDVPQATRGREVFQHNCGRCHGTYEKDENLLPVFRPPVHVPISVVRTDADRLQNLTPEFFAIAARNPLVDLIRCLPNYQPGYLAPRLEGVWARFPYLHNGSVPSVADLLAPPDQRPIAFELQDAGEVARFDSERLGLTVPRPKSYEAEQLVNLGEAGRRDVYLVTREGHGNGGHEFGTSLSADAKRALIEYLKTL